MYEIVDIDENTLKNKLALRSVLNEVSINFKVCVRNNFIELLIL